MRRLRLLGLLPVLLLASCKDVSGLGGTTLVPGTYVLAQLDERPLPAVTPCGSYRVLEGHITLGPNREARHFLHHADPSSGRERVYNGTGTYRRDGDALVLTLTGGWSHTGDIRTGALHLGIDPDGLRRFTGMECDAHVIELYRRP